MRRQAAAIPCAKARFQFRPRPPQTFSAYYTTHNVATSDLPATVLRLLYDTQRCNLGPARQ